jgi:hypothetical protein
MKYIKYLNKMEGAFGSIHITKLEIGKCYIEWNFPYDLYWTSPLISKTDDMPEFGDKNGSTIVNPSRFFWYTPELLLSLGVPSHKIPIKPEIISIPNAILSDKIYILDPNYTDPIDLDYFEDNEEIVTISENNTEFIFRRSTIEKWFDADNVYKNPLTNTPILRLNAITRYKIIILSNP